MREGWQIKTLGDICNIARGGSPRPIQKFLTNRADGINWIKIADATASSKYIYKTEEKIIPEGAKRSRLVKPGDFLLSNSMSFGRPYIMKTTGCIHDGWLVLSDKSGLFDQDYLYYFLGSAAAYRQFDNLAAGFTVRNLNAELVKRVTVPLPPLPEQQRIVAILDEALAGLATATANAEKNLKNARELFDNYLFGVFGTGADDWEKRTFAECSTVESGAGFPKEYQGKSSGQYPFYKVSDMNLPGNEVRLLAHNNAVSEKVRAKLGAKVFSKGAVIFPKIGAAIATNKKRIVETPCCVDNNVMGVIPWPQSLDSDFLYFLLRSLNISDFANDSELPSIRRTTVEAWQFKAPRAVPDQQRVAASLWSVLEQSQLLESRYAAKIDALAELKQSILQKAFSGELTSLPSQAIKEAAE